MGARYNKINDFYNEDHKMTWVREDEFRYAFSAVKTRGMSWSHGPPDGVDVPCQQLYWISQSTPKSAYLTVSPVFDMINHSPKANLRWKGNVETSALELFALDDIDIGEELTINYGTGANGNRDMLKSYGFTQSDEELVKRDKLEFT